MAEPVKPYDYHELVIQLERLTSPTLCGLSWAQVAAMIGTSSVRLGHYYAGADMPEEQTRRLRCLIKTLAIIGPDLPYRTFAAWLSHKPSKDAPSPAELLIEGRVDLVHDRARRLARNRKALHRWRCRELQAA